VSDNNPELGETGELTLLHRTGRWVRDKIAFSALTLVFLVYSGFAFYLKPSAPDLSLGFFGIAVGVGISGVSLYEQQQASKSTLDELMRLRHDFESLQAKYDDLNRKLFGQC
jgi:hypothetical protein